jgi:hypothetical protein
MVPGLNGPLMPSGFVCFFAATVPPIWNRFVLQPPLRMWDTRFATPAKAAVYTLYHLQATRAALAQSFPQRKAEEQRRDTHQGAPLSRTAAPHATPR